ncbi:Lipoprotein [Caenorhabditis elegans]|uniref:Lipoprotein n=1 Tax=Caenorhabditis elegans TaxID=6239 RepID=O45175_CAEEL|nr:Lipoprotein [Caenorhabditis elegans]CCD70612.1 Lipoprotein [Caenorhabditis elegans]|eukprot:NP_501385.2 Uncharacterized protein CELE_K07H8.7 [Caenorhabditis elegans]
MLSNWNNFYIHLILLKSQIFSMALIISLISGVLILCSQKGGGSKTKNADSRTKKSASTSIVSPIETTAIPKDSVMVKPEPPKEETKSKKSVIQNSIKMLRGKKNLQKATTLQKKTETDSQHTQVINMELGKAAGSEKGISKLTVPEERKIVEKPNGKKVQFADKLIKSTLTPTEKK